MNLRFSEVLIAALAFCCAAMFVPSAVARNDRASAIDAIVAAYMQAAHIPGVAVAVIENGKVETLRGCGLANVEWNGKATDKTPSRAARSGI